MFEEMVTKYRDMPADKGMIPFIAKTIVENPQDPTSLITFLSNFSLSDPLFVSIFNSLRKCHLDCFTLMLAKFFGSLPSFSTRDAAFELLTRLLSRSHFGLWPKLDAPHRRQLRPILIDILRNEKRRDYTQKLHALVADIVSKGRLNDDWSPLVEFVIESLFSDSKVVQESGLLLFSKLANPLSQKFYYKADILGPKFLMFLDSTCGPNVRVASVKASVNMVRAFPGWSGEQFKLLLPQILTVLFTLMYETGSQQFARQVLDDLTLLVREMPHLFQIHIGSMIYQLLEAAAAEIMDLEVETRLLCVEFIVVLAEHKQQGRSMLLNLQSDRRIFLSVILMMLEEIKEDPNWDNADRDDINAGDSRMCCVGRKSFARFATAVGGNIIMEHAPETNETYLGSLDWEKRHAALTFYSILAGCCSKVVKENLSQLVKLVMDVLNRELHPRVLWAALNTLAEFSKHLSPEFQEEYHQEVLPRLTTAMDDFMNPRIQVQATSAVQFFCNNCAPNILTPYLEKIIGILIKFLKKGKQMLKEVALTALASIAKSTQEQFQKYYNTVIPYLKVILMSATHGSDRMLLPTCMECIIMIWTAVGKENIKDDIQLVARALISFEGFKLEIGDPMRSHILLAWGMLCKCLGKEFSPYLALAIPRLLQSAQLTARETTVSKDSDSSSLADDQSFKTATAEDERIETKTNVIEEKIMACDILCRCCAAELKEDFYLWTDEVAHTLVTLLKFDLHEKVRTAAASAMPAILRSSKSATQRGYFRGLHESPFGKLSAYIIPALVEALCKESAKNIRAGILDSLTACIQIYGCPLRVDNVRHILDEVTEVLKADSFEKTEREKRIKEKDIPAEERALLIEENEQEEKIYTKAGDCLVTFIKTYKASVFPFFGSLLPSISLIWGNDQTTKERRTGLRIFHTVAEQCRERAFKYFGPSLQHLIEASKNENPEVQEVAVRAIGVWAEFSGRIFKPFVQVVVSSLNDLIRDPKALEADYVMVHDIAVSALGKIYKFHPESINAAEVVSTWLNNLPIRNDIDEAKVVHDQLYSMVNEEDKSLLGPHKSNLPKIIEVFAAILWAGNILATAETVGGIIDLLKKMEVTLAPSMWEKYMADLQPFHRNLLEYMLST